MAPTQLEIALTAALAKHIHGKTRTGPIDNAILKHPLLCALGEGSLTREQLQRFCVARFTASEDFERMLEAAMLLAEKEGKTELAIELSNNLRDERGLDRETGQPTQAGPHSQWRKDFMEALGIVSTPGEKKYTINEGEDLAILSGMLLTAEFAIPPEYKRVMKCVQRHFPDSFSSDLEEEDPIKRKNSRYLLDHIEHDSGAHFPDLRRAICIELPDRMEDVIRGIERFASEGLQFFSAIQQSIGLPDTERSLSRL
jgi:hypothetical protein